jgi:hypothetical protein
VTAYRFYFGRVLGYIKADRRSIPTAFQDIAIGPGRDLVLVARDYEESSDLRAVKTVVRTAVGAKSIFEN